MVFLLGAAVRSFAGGPGPVKKIALQPFGFKRSNKDIATLTDIKWQGQYVVIRLTYMACGKCRPDSTNVACGECGPNSTFNYIPGPRLVVDSATGQQMPPETVDDALLEPNPQDFLSENKSLSTADGEVLSQWRGMMLVRNSGGKLWLEEPGHVKTLLLSRCDCQSAVFLGQDRILITGYPFRQWVVDKSGAFKYKLPSVSASSMDYYALSRVGSRFAVRDIVGSKAKGIGELLSLDIYIAPLDIARVRVFAADDGQKLFEDEWHMEKHEIYTAAQGVALSDDGTLLAVIKGTDLLIFKVP